MKNCLTYVIKKIISERRAGRRGGYVIIRRSHLAMDFGIRSPWHPASWVPHFLHRDQDGKITQYCPTYHQRISNALDGLFIAYLRLWHFDGEVSGDDDLNFFTSSNPRLNSDIHQKKE